MSFAFRFALFLILPGWAWAAPGVSCRLSHLGEDNVLAVPEAPDALGGTWQTLGKFRVRTVLAAPPERAPWLLVDIHAEAADGDIRIIASHKVFAPFATGQLTVVEPVLGRVLRYECGAVK